MLQHRRDAGATVRRTRVPSCTAVHNARARHTGHIDNTRDRSAVDTAGRERIEWVDATATCASQGTLPRQQISDFSHCDCNTALTTLQVRHDVNTLPRGTQCATPLVNPTRSGPCGAHSALPERVRVSAASRGHHGRRTRVRRAHSVAHRRRSRTRARRRIAGGDGEAVDAGEATGTVCSARWDRVLRRICASRRRGDLMEC